MKKLCILLSIVLALICLNASAFAQTELVVFAAASLTETMETIKSRYEVEHEDVTIVCNFDSSGTLKKQIEEGAVCDLFISAAPKQMDELHCVYAETRVDLLENKVTLVVPEGNPANIQSFEDLIGRLNAGTVLLAMGNSDVPVGQYTQKLFAHFGVDEAAVSACLTYGTNVKEVTTQVREGAVDCGIIYSTDAFSAGLTPVDTATEEMCGRVVYPAAVLTTSNNGEAARAFLDALKQAAASEVFASVGFTPLAK